MVSPPNHSFLLLVFFFKFTIVPFRLGFFHPLILGVSHYICSQPFNPMGIHLLHCAHGGDTTTLHDVMQDGFTIVVKDARFHVSQEQTHVLLPLAL
jgi:hypothetical protein